MEKIFYDLRGILSFPVSSGVRMAGMVRTNLEWALRLMEEPHVEFVAPGLSRAVKGGLGAHSEFALLASKLKNSEKYELTEQIATILPAGLSRRDILSKIRRKLAYLIGDWRFPKDTAQFLESRKPFPSRSVYFLPSVKKMPRRMPVGCVPVINVYDLIPMVFKDGVSSKAASYREAIETVKKLNGHFIVNSEHVRHSLICMFDISVEMVHVVQLGVKPLMKSEALKEQMKLSKPYFIHIAGNCQRRKNIEGTIEGFVKFLDLTKSSHHLKIVGPTDCELREIIHQTGGAWGHRIIGAGHVSEVLLQRLIENAECGLYLSLYEGFGLPPLEYMQWGLPVICSNVTSIPEVVGDAAILVNPFSKMEIALALKQVVESPELRSTMSIKGRAKAKELSWRNSSNQLIDVLYSIYK